MSPIINVEDFLSLYQNPDVIICDVSGSQTAKANYDNTHIDGAIFVDINTHLAAIQDDFANGGRHPLPKVEDFRATLTELGIDKDSHVIVYDDMAGANAAARFWWMLKAVGHKKVQVLNGGLTYAKQQGVPINAQPVPIKKAVTPYPVTAWQLPLVDMADVEKMANDPDCLVMDVRDVARYSGKVEPIDLIAGHIPQAMNVPFAENLDNDGLFLSANKLRTKYEKIFGDIPPERIAIHCGSGVTACHTLLALYYAGIPMPNLYVGSWSEWSRNDKPMVTLVEN